MKKKKTPQRQIRSRRKLFSPNVLHFFLFGFSRNAYKHRHAHTDLVPQAEGSCLVVAVCCLHFILKSPSIERINTAAVAAADTVTHFAQHSDEVSEPHRVAMCIGISRLKYLRAYHICINSGGGGGGDAASAPARRYIGISCDELFFVLLSGVVRFAHAAHVSHPQSQIHQKRITTTRLNVWQKHGAAGGENETARKKTRN